MKKVGIFFVAIALFFGAITGCTGGGKPEDAVKGYFQAAKNFDGKAMAGFIIPLNTEDREQIEELGTATVDNEISKYMVGYLRDNAKKMTYQIKSSSSDGNKAKVTVESKYVDDGPLMKEVLGEVIGEMVTIAFSGQESSGDAVTKLFSDLIKEKRETYPETFKTETLEIALVKQDDKWFIDQVDDKMQDVISSGFMSVLDLGNAFSQ